SGSIDPHQTRPRHRRDFGQSDRDQTLRPLLYASAPKMSGRDSLKFLPTVWKERVPFGTHWEMLAVTAVLFVLVVVFVDLKPVVEENFFFSTSDPGFGQSKKIEQRFPSQPQLVLAVSSGDISSPRYFERIQKLTREAEAIDGVSAVKSLTAIIWFGLTMAAMFRSSRVFLGMLATCTSAVLLTLLLQQIFGRRIGILTVYLGTIVFVVAMSHLVYMTFNWQTLADRSQRLEKKSPDLATDALRMTFPPSFWSMVCASLGFASLLIVQAK